MIKRLFLGLLLVGGLVSCAGSGTSVDAPTPSATEDPLAPLRVPGCKIAVGLGSSHDKYATEHFPKAEILRPDSYANITPMLESGRCDYGFFDETLATDVMRKDSNYRVAASDFASIDLGIGFRKEEKKLAEAFNRFLAELKSNGIYEQMCKRWIEGDWATAKMPDLGLPTKGTPLVVGAEGVNPPLNFISNGSFAGLDIELVLRFGKSMNRPVKIQNMNFGALIPALMSGKIDVVASMVSITPERAEQITFSNPYFSQKIVVLAYAAKQGGGETASFWTGFKRHFYKNLVEDNRYQLLLNGLYATLVISIFAILLGTVLGGVVCGVQMSRYASLRYFAKQYVDLLRGTPVLVLLMIFFYVVFAKTSLSGISVAVITLALNFSAYVSEMFRAAIESIDKGQREAGIAMGFSKVQTFLYIQFPQALRRVLPVYKGEAISLIKMTSVVGYVAVVDLTKASDIIRSRTFDAFFPLILIAIIYFILAWLFGLLLDCLSKKVTSR